MKTRLSLFCIAITMLLSVNIANAQHFGRPGVGLGGQQSTFQAVSGELLQPGLPGRLWFETNFADQGLGFDGSYVTLGGKTRLFQDALAGRWLLEGQLNHSIEDDGGFFANIGLERVFSIPAANADISFGAFYDFDDDDQQSFSDGFHQVGVSGAIKTRNFDLIGNGYFPVGTDAFTQGDINGVDHFFGNNIALQAGIESALEGFDVTLRTRPKQLAFVNGYVDFGGYHYDSDLVDNFAGGRLRVGMQLFNNLSLAAEVNHDERFDTTGSLSVALTFGSRNSGYGSEYAGLARDLEQTSRNDHIVRFNQDLIVAINPLTGQAFNVIHADNTQTQIGDGSFESPFATLAEAEAGSAANDIIFVNNGDGTSNGYDTGITLQDGQQLLGDGVTHTLALSDGSLHVLSNDMDGARPILTNPGGDIVTLADDNTVRGFVLDGTGVPPANNGIAGTNVTGNTLIENNDLINLDVDGVQINGLNGNLAVANNTFDHIGRDGVRVNNVTSLGNTLTFSDNTFDEISESGIRLDTFNSENTFNFINNTFTNVGPVVSTEGIGDGIALLNGSNAIVGTGGTFNFTNNNIDTVTGNGINITDVIDPEAVFNFNENTINNPGLNGLAFVNSQGALNFTGGTFTGATNGAGFLFDANSGGPEALTLTNFTATGNDIGVIINASNSTDLELVINDNLFDNNLSHGIQINAEDAGTAIQLTSFAGNTVTNNGGRGLEINGLADTVIDAVVVENLFQNNAEGGLVATTFDGELNATIGGVARTIGVEPGKVTFPQNQFLDNGEVGIALAYTGDGTGRFDIQDNIVTGTTNGATVTPFEGDGIHVRLAADETLQLSTAFLPGGSTIADNEVASNVGDGIELFAEDNSFVAGLDIVNNTTDNNGQSGIRVAVNDSAFVNNVLIENNVSNSNGSDGVEITASEFAFISAVAPFGIRNNELTNNTNGISLTTAADALIDVDIFQNEISNNTLDGIVTTEIFNTISDFGVVSGDITENEIVNNGANGIDLGANLNDLLVADNRINSNGLFGIDIPGAGDGSFLRNEIIGNGTNAGARGTSGGINIDGPGFKSLFFSENNIFQNTGDGVRIVNSGYAGEFAFNLVFDSNTVEANTDRGFSVLNQGIADTNLTLINNTIAANEDEGVFVVNTASTTQTLDQNINPINDNNLNADGDITDDARLNLIVEDNLIVNNGGGNSNEANGLVLLVGTTDGGYAFDEDGGFFGEGFGGIGATINRNVLTGNAGDDIFIRSFVSTVDPATTGGAFTDQNEDPRDNDNDVFNPTGFQGDPLARLDLVFGVGADANIFLSAALNNPGAFFNNDESVFKSRTAGQDNDTDTGLFDDDGPFNSGTRNRNAQRLAARNVGIGSTQLDPQLPIGNSDAFLFAGVGQSTFRILNDAADFADLQAVGFAFDAGPYIDFTSSGATNINNIPFGYNFFNDNVDVVRPQ